MATVVGVRFREVGKIYSFDPGELVFRRGDHVIAETAKGYEYGTVVLGNHPDNAPEHTFIFNYSSLDSSMLEQALPVLAESI